MLKVHLKLQAMQDFPGWKKGETLEIITDVFSKENGIAFYSLSRNWEVIRMKIIEYESIDRA